MSIAILGGTGFVGTEVARRVLARGMTPLVLARGRHPVALPDGACFETADRTDGARLAELLRANGITTLIDIFAFGLANTAPVLQAMGAVGGRYVPLSSVDVYSNYGGLLGRDTPPVQLAPVTEDDPLRAFRFPFRPDAPPPGGIGDDPFADYDKIILEEASRSDGRFETSIIRAPMIFGPGDRQHRFKWAIDAVDAAPTGGTIELDERAARWPASYAYITDIAEAIVLAATAPAAAGRIYNVGQPFVRNALEWLLSFAAVMQKPLEVLTVPAARRGLLAEQADSANLDYPLIVDSSRIRAELGFAEIVPKREALLATIAVERAQRPH